MSQNNDKFFNTTSETGETLKQFEEKAARQEMEILEVFKEISRNTLYDRATPHQIYRMLDGKYMLTSVRRAITTLTKKGLLIKTDMKVPEMYGRPSYLWELNKTSHD